MYINNTQRFPYPLRPEKGTGYRFDADAFAFECKANEARAMYHNPTGHMISRHGNPVDTTPYKEALSRLPKSDMWEWVDIGLFGSPRTPGLNEGVIMVIDLPAIGDLPYCDRHRIIREYFPDPSFRVPFPLVFRPPVVYNNCGLAHAREQMLLENEKWGVTIWEGFVGKRLTSPYPINTTNPNKTTNHWYKERFI